jgi:hypothetical protein
MYLEWFVLHKLQQTHILHQYRIDTYLGQLVNEVMNLIELVVVNDSVERDVDLCTKLVCIIAELADVIDAVSHRSARSEFGCSDIYGIGTMIDGSNTASQILGWS